MCSAKLAHHGLLGSVKSPVPAQRLASLASCVTWDLHINNVTGCDLVSLLSLGPKCQELYIRQSLGREETLAL